MNRSISQSKRKGSHNNTNDCSLNVTQPSDYFNESRDYSMNPDDYAYAQNSFRQSKN